MTTVLEVPTSQSTTEMTISEATLTEAYHINEDYDLISEAQAGQTEAFGALYSRYATPVTRRLVSLCNGNLANAEDIAQDTFVKAFTHISKISDKSKGAEPWLHTIAHNTFIDHVRKTQRIRIESLDSTPLKDTRTIEQENHVSLEETVATRVDLAKYIDGVLATIPSKLVDALKAIDGAGLTYDEAAVLLGIKMQTVRTRLYRGRQRFMQAPKPEGYSFTSNRIAGN